MNEQTNTYLLHPDDSLQSYCIYSTKRGISVESTDGLAPLPDEKITQYCCLHRTNIERGETIGSIYKAIYIIIVICKMLGSGPKCHNEGHNALTNSCCHEAHDNKYEILKHYNGDITCTKFIADNPNEACTRFCCEHQTIGARLDFIKKYEETNNVVVPYTKTCSSECLIL